MRVLKSACTHPRPYACVPVQGKVWNINYFSVQLCTYNVASCHAGQCSTPVRARRASACAPLCVLVCLHVILSQRWQVRESNVMRLSPSWFKHERGEMETEEENQFSVLRQRNKEGLSLQRRNSLPHFTARERKKK